MIQMQKKILSIFLCIICSFPLFACGTNTSANMQEKEISESSSQIVSIESFTDENANFKKINTVMGDVEIPTQPQRIVVQYLMGDFVALGIKPVGISETHEGAAFESAVTTATDLGLWEFDLEELMTLEPDLIVAVNEDQYDDFSKIAPTVIIPYGSMSTQARLTFLGEVTNRQEEAQKVWLDYSKKIQSAKQTLQEDSLQDSTVTILQVNENGISVAGSKHALGILAYDELGLIPPIAVQEDIIDKDEYWGKPSMEVLAKYCGEYVVHLGPVPEKVAQNAVWNAIPAVKAQNVIECDTALTYYTDVMSSTVLIDYIVNKIIVLSVK